MIVFLSIVVVILVLFCAVAVHGWKLAYKREQMAIRALQECIDELDTFIKTHLEESNEKE